MKKPTEKNAFGELYLPISLSLVGIAFLVRSAPTVIKKNAAVNLPDIVQIELLGLSESLTAAAVVLLVSMPTVFSLISLLSEGKSRDTGLFSFLAGRFGAGVAGFFAFLLFLSLILSNAAFCQAASDLFLISHSARIKTELQPFFPIFVLLSAPLLLLFYRSFRKSLIFLLLLSFAGLLFSVLFINPDLVPAGRALIFNFPKAELTEQKLLLILPSAILIFSVRSFTQGFRQTRSPMPAAVFRSFLAAAIFFSVLIGSLFFNIPTDYLENFGTKKDFILHVSFLPQLTLAGLLILAAGTTAVSLKNTGEFFRETAREQLLPDFLQPYYDRKVGFRLGVFLSFLGSLFVIYSADFEQINYLASLLLLGVFFLINFVHALSARFAADFRPVFKFPALLSVFGALISGLLLARFNIFFSLFLPFAFLFAFLFFKRKELDFSGNGIFRGFWLSYLRFGLGNLKKNRQNGRWMPNILAFVGSSRNRPHMAEFGELLIGKFGIISLVNILVNSELEVPIARLNGPPAEGEKKGIFKQKFRSRSLTEGMELVAGLYGFSGLEPNTVLCGLGKETEDTEKFNSLYKIFKRSNLNILFLEYHKIRRFGSAGRIDIWWDGKDANLNFVLTLMRSFHTGSVRKVKNIRVLVYNSENIPSANLVKIITQLAVKERLNVLPKIISPNLDRSESMEIIAFESEDADLTFLALPPEIDPDYFNRLAVLKARLGSFCLVGATLFFRDKSLNVPETEDKKSIQEIPDRILLPTLREHRNSLWSRQIQEIDSQMLEIIRETADGPLRKLFFSEVDFWNKTVRLLEKTLLRTAEKLQDCEKEKKASVFLKIKEETDKAAAEIFEEFGRTVLPQNAEAGRELARDFEQKLNNLILSFPKTEIFLFPTSDFTIQKNDSFRRISIKILTGLGGYYPAKNIQRTVRLRLLYRFWLYEKRRADLQTVLGKYGSHAFEAIQRVREIFNESDEILAQLLRAENETFDEIVELGVQALQSAFHRLRTQRDALREQCESDLYRQYRDDVQSMMFDTEDVDYKHFISVRKQQFFNERKESDEQEFGPDWQENIQLYFNTVRLDSEVRQLQNRAEFYIREASALFRALSNHTFFIPIAFTMQQIENELDNKEIDEDFLPEFTDETPTSLQREFVKVCAKIRREASEISDRLHLPSEKTSQAISEGDFSRTEPAEIALRRLVGFHIEADFVGPVQERLELSDKKFRETFEEIREAVQSCLFNLKNDDNQDKVKDYRRTVLVNTLLRIRSELKKVQNEPEQIDKELKLKLNRAFDPLRVSVLLRSSENLDMQIRKAENRKNINRLHRVRRKTSEIFRRKMTQLMYSRSEGVIWAGKLAGKNMSQSAAEKAVDFITVLTGNSEIIKKLPFYYVNLFGGKAAAGTDFWVGREKECEVARKAVLRRKNGLYGAWLITGERLSGKSALAEKIAGDHFGKKKIFRLEAPVSGTSERSVFHSKLAEAFGTPLKIDDYFSQTNNDIVLIVNSLELWWERRPEGLEVLSELRRLVDSYGHKCLFLLECNEATFRILDKINRFSELCTEVIRCEPFDAEELKDLVMLRHRSAGLEFETGGRTETQLSAFAYASLFSRFFNVSKGNAGLSLLLWLASISEAGERRVKLLLPVLPRNGFPLPENEDLLMVLVMFVLHRNLGREKILRLSNRPEALRAFERLRRTGLLEETEAGLYEIRPLIAPFLSRKLKEKGLI